MTKREMNEQAQRGRIRAVERVGVVEDIMTGVVTLVAGNESALLRIGKIQQDLADLDFCLRAK